MQVRTAPRIDIDRTYGGVYAGTSFEFSPAVVDHFNRAALEAANVLPGEFEPLEPGEYCSISCPTAPLPREQFVGAYHELLARLDGEIDLRLGDFPRLFSTHSGNPGLMRGVPTYIPKARFPGGFFGRAHRLELFQNGELIFGPVERFFHTPTSGAIFNQIEDAPGCLVAEIRGNLSVLAKSRQVVFFTDPAFGEPTGVVQLDDDGCTIPLTYELLGKDYVGDRMLFNEGVVLGVAPRGSSVVLEMSFADKATGVAAALYSGHTRATAFRADATVL